MISRTNLGSTVTYHIGSIILSVFFLFPIFWSLAASFRPEIAVFQGMSPLSIKMFLPSPFTWGNYIGVFTNTVFSKALVNTFLVTAITIVVGVIINAMAGFAFSTMKFKGKNILFTFVLISFMMPGDLLVIPTYNLVDSMHLIDTKVALILPMLGNGIVIFMFLQFYNQIPIALREAAIIDGASDLHILKKIYFPLTIPTMIGAALILFLGQWESFLWPLVVSRSAANGMIQVAMSTFSLEHGTLWGMKMAAASVLCFIPLIILMPLQKYYIGSIASSAIKG